MLETLHDEGWELDQRELQKIRIKNGFKLRTDAGLRQSSIADGSSGKKRKRWYDPDPRESAPQHGETSTAAEQAAQSSTLQAQETVGLSPDEALRRAQRFAQIQAESDSLLQARKRRRRIRGYGHLGPDDPTIPPRYVSETSLDECKAYLQLDNSAYKAMREQFTAICAEAGIVKKTTCAPGAWELSKDRLVRENMHLSAVMNPLQPNIDKKVGALDVICSDVTKRLRNVGIKLTIADANNALGLNPDESKELRRLFYELLVKDHFVSRLICGDEHWDELKQIWLTKDTRLQLLASDRSAERDKLLSVLMRDAMKRYMDDKVKRDPSAKQHTDASYGPGPGPARRNKSGDSRMKEAAKQLADSKAAQAAKTTTPASANPRSKQQNAALSALELDPALFAAAANSVIEPAPVTTAEFASQTIAPTSAILPSPAPVPTVPTATTSQPTAPQVSIPAYFRLSPSSSIVGHHPRMWLGKLAFATISDLHRAGTAKAGAARVGKVHGIIKAADAPHGTEDSYQIDSQDELDAYLAEVGEGGKATFVVQLEGGYA